jgi:hypothetical protein
MEKDKNILLFSIPIAILSFVSCVTGVFYSDVIYAREVVSYKTQGIGQDLVTLIIVLPTLIVSMYFAYQKKVVGILLWGGCLFYYFYTYLIYSFGLHFNRLFLLYCILLGLSAYGFLYFFVQYAKRIISNSVKLRHVAVYLYIIAGLFYLLWLSEEIPSAIANAIPKSVTEANIMVNTVHVADISLCLPFLIVTGILLQRGKQIGIALAPVALFFSVLLALAVLGMILVMARSGVETDFGLTIAFALVFVISLSLLVDTILKLKKSSPKLMRTK